MHRGSLVVLVLLVSVAIATNSLRDAVYALILILRKKYFLDISGPSDMKRLIKVNHI